MTPEQITQAMAERWNAGDDGGFLDLFSEDIAWTSDPTWPETGIAGRAATARWVSQWREAWQTVTLEIVTPVEPLGDRWVVHGRWRMTGQASRLEQDAEFWLEITVEDSLITAARFHTTPEDVFGDRPSQG